MATLTVTFTPPSPAPENYRIRYRKKFAVSDPYTFVTGAGSPVVITGLAANQDYEGRIESNCGGAFSIQVLFSTSQFSSGWSVLDVWFDCSDETCDGEAIYCDWWEIRRTSDNLLIYRYDHDDSNFYKAGTFQSLVNGVNYTVTASWVCDTAKTNFNTSQITCNSSTGIWSESPGTTTSHSMSFNANNFNNHVNIASSSTGASCDCSES